MRCVGIYARMVLRPSVRVKARDASRPVSRCNRWPVRERALYSHAGQTHVEDRTMSTPFPSPASLDRKDRRAACIAFGIAEIGMGLLCGAMAVLVLFAASVVVPGSVDLKALVVSLSVYALPAAALVWLGIGSALCRRWARTLLLILAWSWLVAGVTAIGMLAIILPQMLAQLAPGAAGLVVGLVLLGVVTLSCVVVPGAMILFYQGRNVQATFEARDPHPRWTDTCPLPVLTTALWFAIGAILVVPAVADGRAVIPFFGQLVSGRPATLLSLIAAGISLWLAWGFVRLERVALWASLALTAIASVSATATFARVDFLEVYRLMGYPPEQIEAIRQMGLFSGQTMTWMMALLGIATCAFLVWLKKYFPAASSSATAPTQGTLTRT
jgi:hypothetical protein